MIPRVFSSRLLTVSAVVVSAMTSQAALTVTSGLELHFDASSITGLSEGDDVTSWADSSGNDRDLTATVGSTPTAPTYRSTAIGGMPAVRFAGGGLVGSFGTNSFSVPGTTMFLVFRSTTTSQGTFVSLNDEGSGTNQSFLYINRFDSGGLFGTFNASSGDNGSTQDLNGPYNDGAAHLFTAYTSSPTISLRGDGGTETKSYTQGFDTTDVDGVTLGVLNNGDSSRLNGDIAEVLVYGRELDSLEIESVETYLIGKYSIVPEPSAALLAALCGGIALLRRRR